ncbi:sensor histidine kinase [Roseivirga sp.]|uniref:sensor histidine kinase n=1 Tax=Roseivirga sp. TaxID=1964215 RepID=UPI003B8D6624
MKINIAFSSFLMPITIASCYVMVYYLIPKYLLLKKYSSFLLYGLYTFILTAFAVVLSVFYALIFILDLKIVELPIARSFPFILIAVYLIIFLASGITLLRHYYGSKTNNDKLLTKVLETQLKLKEQELKYLKMQIHPHFLFNTLNTLYGFALSKAEETPDLILKLSNLLDYLLYQVDKPMVDLSSEMNHIQDYIDLEKTRFSDSLDIRMKLEDFPAELQVAPMLFIPFVENSFKHGGSTEGKLQIDINVKAELGKVNFSISNTLRESLPFEKGEGIGLENIKKRLSMLYADRHELRIEKTPNRFNVELIIDTNG